MSQTLEKLGSMQLQKLWTQVSLRNSRSILFAVSQFSAYKRNILHHDSVVVKTTIRLSKAKTCMALGSDR